MNRPDGLRFLEAIQGDSDGFLEIRLLGAGPTVQRYFTDPAQAFAYALDMDSAGQLQVFVGMAPRDREDGTAEAVSRAFVVSADCDDDASLDALLAFPITPSIVIASGSRTDTDRAKLHAHWLTDVR